MIKSYTDINQSKKLAKILPLETADMFMFNNVGTSGKVDGTNTSVIFKEYFNPLAESPEILPCWSLTALLNVLPTIDDEFEPQLHRTLDKYCCTYEGKEDSNGLWRVADNPIDACVDMIEKLHKLNLL